MAENLEAFRQWVNWARDLFPKEVMPLILEEMATFLTIVENFLSVRFPSLFFPPQHVFCGANVFMSLVITLTSQRLFLSKRRES